MSNRNEIVRLAVDTYKGKVAGDYSVDKSNEVLREAIIAANNGKDYLDRKDVRDGKCGELFAIIEETIAETIIDGLQGNEFFMDFVEFKNLALGDQNSFYIPDESYFYVDDVARGTQGLRRQRLSGGRTISVNTKNYGVKVYEELDRTLSGRSSLTDMITRVGESIQKKQYDDIFAKWTSIVNKPAGDGTPYIPATGTYNEEALLTLCEHVEVNSGTTPVIMGTRAALRHLTTAEVSEVAKTDKYNIGYYGKFNGIPMVRLARIHATNTNTFVLPDNQVYVIGVSANVKPIKYVNEGTALIVPPQFAVNGDFSEDYLFINKAGCDVVMPKHRFGVYTW